MVKNPSDFRAQAPVLAGLAEHRFLPSESSDSDRRVLSLDDNDTCHQHRGLPAPRIDSPDKSDNLASVTGAQRQHYRRPALHAADRLRLERRAFELVSHPWPGLWLVPRRRYKFLDRSRAGSTVRFQLPYQRTPALRV